MDSFLYLILQLPALLLALFGGLGLILTECTDDDFIESLPLLSLSGPMVLFVEFVVFVVSVTMAVAQCDVGAVVDCSPSSPVVCRWSHAFFKCLGATAVDGISSVKINDLIQTYFFLPELDCFS